MSLRNHLKKKSHPICKNLFQNNGSVKFINSTASLLGCLPSNGISDSAEADAGLHLNLTLMWYVIPRHICGMWYMMSFLTRIWSTAGFTAAIVNIDSGILCVCFCLFSWFSYIFPYIVFFLCCNINENTWFFLSLCTDAWTTWCWIL